LVLWKVELMAAEWDNKMVGSLEYMLASSAAALKEQTTAAPTVHL